MPDQLSDAPNATIDLATVSAADFRRAMGAVFRLSHQGGDIDLHLVEINERGGTSRTSGAFSLLFTSVPGPSLPQAIYPLVHPQMGSLALFLVPIGPIDARNGYEAVFA